MTGVLAEMNDALVAAVRTIEGRFPGPSTGVIAGPSHFKTLKIRGFIYQLNEFA